MALVGALVGSSAGLVWVKPENRERATRNVAVLARLLGGAIIGLGVGMIGVSSQLRYEVERIRFEGKEKRIEPPRDPNGYLRVWLFGQPVYDEAGPREQMIVWHRQLNWFILIAFGAGGAFLGALLGLLPRRQTGKKASAEPSAGATQSR
jgi:hypothetical protein